MKNLAARLLRVEKKYCRESRKGKEKKEDRTIKSLEEFKEVSKIR